MRLSIATLSLALTMALLGPVAQAAEVTAGANWHGEVELGMLAATGNTRTRTGSFKVMAIRKSGPWTNELRLEAMKNADNDVTTAERYLVGDKATYLIGERNYLYGAVRYEDDRFSGYDYQTTESAGYGRRFIYEATYQLDGEVGAGASQRMPELGEREDEAIARLAGTFTWQVNEHTSFRQELATETGRKNTYTESVTALKLRIGGSLAAKLVYTYRHNSHVPMGVEQTDTISTVNLVYDL